MSTVIGIYPILVIREGSEIRLLDQRGGLSGNNPGLFRLRSNCNHPFLMRKIFKLFNSFNHLPALVEYQL
jgi:hypothetical protein